MNIIDRAVYTIIKHYPQIDEVLLRVILMSVFLESKGNESYMKKVAGSWEESNG